MWAWVHLRSEQSALERSARLCGRHSRLSSDHHGPSVRGHEVDAPDGAGTHEEHRAEVLPEHGRVHRCRWHCKKIGRLAVPILMTSDCETVHTNFDYVHKYIRPPLFLIVLHINHVHIVYKGGVQDILWITSHYLYNPITPHAHLWQKKSSVAGRGCSTSSRTAGGTRQPFEC